MILVAKCRTGFPCRYHGRPVYSPAIITKIKNIPHELVCPECEAGLSVPRPPIRINNGRYRCGGKDITALLHGYCKKKAKELSIAGIGSLFIGVKDSPCCDPHKGLFAKYLLKIAIKSYLSMPGTFVTDPKITLF